MNGDNPIGFREAAERLDLRWRDIIIAALQHKIEIYNFLGTGDMWVDADEIEVLRPPA